MPLIGNNTPSFSWDLGMSNNKKLHIGMSLAPTWLNGDGWRRSDSDIEGIFSSDYYVEIAKLAEKAHLDFVFRPDTLFLDPEAIKNGPGFSTLDPTILLASIARETSNIGLLSTVSTTFYPPYIVARQIQSLNWLSNGRAGWNIVTALEGHNNFGLEKMPSAEERYNLASEFAEVVKLLWDSYPEGAMKVDREAGIWADPSLVNPINHQGTHLRVSGPLNLPSCNKAPIPLVQAGASEAGRNFASSVADAVFASAPDKDVAIELRKDLQARAKRHGRNEEDICLLPGLSLFLAETRAEANDLYQDTHKRLASTRARKTIEQMTGLDLSEWPADKPVTEDDLPPALQNPRSRTHSELLRRVIIRDSPRLADLLKMPEVIGSGHWQVIGTVEDAFESIKDWFADGAIDGFINVPGGSVSSMRLSLEKLMPKLVDAGLLREEYQGNTFASHLKNN